MIASHPSPQDPPTLAAVNHPLLAVEGAGKSYPVAGGGTLEVLHGIHLEVHPGDTCAIVGPSGSGKTTLLGICAGLDLPDSGRVRLAGHDLATLDEDGRAALRNRHVGFVFQNFQLIPTLTALENVLVPLELRGSGADPKAAARLLEQVGLGHRLGHYPGQLSGGEQQRVALARAFIHRPAILFADEPTGNLDDETSRPIEEMLFELNRSAGTALVLVTHDPHLAARASRVVTMRGGTITGTTRHESA